MAHTTRESNERATFTPGRDEVRASHETVQEIDARMRRERDLTKVVDKVRALELIAEIDVLLGRVASLGGELYEALAAKQAGEAQRTTDEQNLALVTVAPLGGVLKVLHRDLKPKVQAL